VGKWIIFKVFMLLQILRYYFFTHSYHRNFLLSVLDMKLVYQVI